MTKTIKTLPYIQQRDSLRTSVAARELRATLQPLMARRLPTVVYGGIKHGALVRWVQSHKKEYPYFLKLDIQKFYPSISHHHLVVEAQLAYKKLLGMQYVPSSFKKKWLPEMEAFFDSLPLQYQGLPLNSGMSKALVPLIYTPFFLDLKQQGKVLFFVFVDDILFLGKNQQDLTTTYYDLHNHLRSMDLQLNIAKIQQGRFATGVLEYCGYRFAGGSVGIAPAKVDQFKTAVEHRAARMPNPFIERQYIKGLNGLLNGFGHYYKCGQVTGLFEELDGYVRRHIRVVYARLGMPFPSNEYLTQLGLVSLALLRRQTPQHIVELKKYERLKAQQRKRAKPTKEALLYNYLEHFDNQNKEIIAQLKRLVSCLS